MTDAELKTKIAVLVVDDSAVMRRILATVLEKDPEINVIGFASNGLEAIEAVARLKPQVVTLDIEMPKLDGIAALKEIRKFAPRLPVIMFSTLTQSGARAAIDALMSGASDYVGKPDASQGMEGAFTVLQQVLIPKIKGLTQRPLVQRALASPQPMDVPPTAPPADLGRAETVRAAPHPLETGRRMEAVCIGVSTGGPMALVSLFEGLRPSVRTPIFIVQHMPAMFTAILAKRLNALGRMPVQEGVHGQEVQDGHVYLAPGGLHKSLKRSSLGKIRLELDDTPPENFCKPAVDVLFRSAARVYGANCLAIVLTGMGHDGLQGARAVKAAGGTVYAQDRESSVIWGMPGAIVNEGLQSKTLPLSQVAGEILRWSAPSPGSE